MGGQSSFQEKFNNKYNFVTQNEDPNFGPVKIYRKKELNFDYVMVLFRRLCSEQAESTMEQLQTIRRSLTMAREPMLLRVLQVEEKNNSCDEKGVRMYIEYLNFTLRDIIEQKRSAGQCFSLDELMYVLVSALDTYSFFKDLEDNHLSLRPSAIFLTPQGFIRFSPIRIQHPSVQPQEQCHCRPEPVLQHFSKSERQFIIEFKNLLHQMVLICPRTHEHYIPSHQLLSRVNQARTVPSLSPLMWKPQVDGLLSCKNGHNSTQVSTVRGAASLRSGHSLHDSGHYII